MKKFYFLFFILALANIVSAQFINPGFESETGTTITGWIKNGSGTEIVGNVNARTGTNALSFTTTSTGNEDMRSTSSISVANNNYVHIIAWAIGNNDNARASVGTVMGTYNTSTNISTIGTTLTRLTFNGQNIQGSPQDAIVKLNSRSVSGSVTLYWDDVVIYSSTSPSVDLVNPTPPTSVTANSNSNGTSINLNWKQGTDAMSGIRGVVILRAEGLSQTPPALNDQGRYSVTGGSEGPNTLGIWNVVGIGGYPTPTTFVDNSILPNTAYTYAIYMRDDAFNYSIGATSDVTALPVELSSFSASVTGSKVKLNWATATEVNNFGFDIQRQGSTSTSLGATGWEKIGFVEGNGNSNSPKSYSFTDNDVTYGKYIYRLKQIDNDGQYEYSKTVEVNLGAPKNYGLDQNFPNPFNPKTTISYNLPEASNVKLTVYNLLGQEVKVLVDEFKEAGSHSVNFDAENLYSGLYIYKMQAGSFTQTRKMTLIK